ncbi:MAG: hypothetical protein E6K46_06030 [Gammaproteobacteria bacterium]|nr:MAG: hypothetical protein E6K46_06030 [Gammaproteobacteria bacterium]
MGDGIALQLRDCLNEMLELEEGGGLDRVNVTRGADDVSEETREIACVVAAVELLALSKAYAPETNAATAIKIAILFISTPIVNILIKPRISEKS